MNMDRKRGCKNASNYNYVTNFDQKYWDVMPFYVETTGTQCLKKGQFEKRSRIQARKIVLSFS